MEDGQTFEKMQLVSISDLWLQDWGLHLMHSLYQSCQKDWRSTDIANCVQFNREKVPERVVHARGFTVKGFFEVRQLVRQAATKLAAEVGLCQLACQ